jgi:multidrug efflux pump subunit AcrA (membrane-fusion protein)
MNKRTMAIAGVSLIALFFAAYAAMRSTAVTTPDAPTAVSTTSAAPVPVKEATVPTSASLKAIPRIDATTLRDRMARGEVVVIDVRDIDSYTASHIAGAIHIPLSRIEGEIPYLKGSKPIVTYCT